MVVMLSVTVEPMSAMQRRCQKTGLKMEEDVNYYVLIFYYTQKQKSLRDQKVKGHVTNSLLLISKKPGQTKDVQCLRKF